MSFISRIVYSHRAFQLQLGIYADLYAHTRATCVTNFILLSFIVPIESGEANEI
jgi:hypothetical protein